MAVSGEVAADTIGEDEDVEIFSREFEFEITVSLWVGLVIVETNVDDVRDGKAESQEILGMLELWAENPLFDEKKNLLFLTLKFFMGKFYFSVYFSIELGKIKFAHKKFQCQK